MARRAVFLDTDGVLNIEAGCVGILQQKGYGAQLCWCARSFSSRSEESAIASSTASTSTTPSQITSRQIYMLRLNGSANKALSSQAS